jgi:hypothetical protein
MSDTPRPRIETRLVDEHPRGTVYLPSRAGRTPSSRATAGKDRQDRIAIVIPVLDDWQAFERLLGEISSVPTTLQVSFVIIAIDDGSSERFAPHALALPGGAIRSVEILQLALNLGHQRAIAVGLVEAARRDDLNAVLVMDGDGEDRPTDLPLLLETARRNPGRIVVAERAERSEGVLFRTGYRIYQKLFSLLTGRRINFGNFSFLPIDCVRRLVLMPELWNNLPAAILRSRIGYVATATSRGSRYAACSRMNWVSLVAHGLSALSVYIDIVFVRMLFGAAILAGVTLAGIAAAVAIRLLTPLAIPGWTTTVVGVLSLLLAQIVMMVVAMLLLVLAGRNSRPIVPMADSSIFVAARQRYELQEPATAGPNRRTRLDDSVLSGRRA